MDSHRDKRPYDALKRALDIIGAVLALILLAPLFILVAITVAIDLGTPVLFTQTRIGRYGRSFALRKFRTMRGANDEGVAGVASDADRISRFGSFLRSTSIDELPEIVHILKGDMSWVGPRPLLPEYLPLYDAHQARRHDVRPGLTGLAQVSGRNALSWEERFDLDVEYVERRSLPLDLWILLRTVGTVLTRSGVSAADSATMEPFTGSRSTISTNEERGHRA